MVPPTVVSDRGCTLSCIQGQDKDRSETGMGGTFFIMQTQNKREEPQDNTAVVTYSIMLFVTGERDGQIKPL